MSENQISKNNPTLNLDELYELITIKPKSSDKNSYSKKLIEQPVNLVAQKIGEEGVEVAISALDHDRHQNQNTKNEIIKEVADLFYHTTALLVKYDIKFSDIFHEFYLRNKK